MNNLSPKFNQRTVLNGALVSAIIALSAGTAQAATQWAGGMWGFDAGGATNLEDNGQLEFRRADGSDNSTAISTAFGQSFDGKFESGATVGLRLGYNMQNDTLVYGGLVDLSYADIAEEQSAFSATPATYIERREAEALMTLRGRLGVASELPVLPFVTAGVAYGDVKYSWEGNSPAFRGDNGEDGDGIGYVVGVGADYKLTEAMVMGVEFLHYNLGDSDYQTLLSGEAGAAQAAFGNAASGGTIQEGSSEDFTFQTFKLSMNWMF